MYKLIEKEMKKCNEICIQLWDSLDQLNKKIESTKDAEIENAFEQHKRLVGTIAELYYLHATIRGDLLTTNELVQALRREVFGRREIALPHQPQNDTTLAETVRRYKENEPTINWLARDLREKANNTERKEEGTNNIE